MPATKSGSICSRRNRTKPRTGARSRGVAASRRRLFTWQRLVNARSGSTAMCAPTSSATCGSFRRSRRCPISGASCERPACGSVSSSNQTELGRDVALPQPTVHRYLNLLETSYLLVRLSAYAVNRTKRLIKSPKLYWGDTGVALYLTEGAEPGGPHLENLVLHDLLAWRDARLDRTEIFYWRTAIGEEVDFVIEASGRLLPIEVKAMARPRLADAAHIRSFQAEYGKKARAGLLLHAGTTFEWLTPGVLAAPWWRVL